MTELPKAVVPSWRRYLPGRRFWLGPLIAAGAVLLVYGLQAGARAEDRYEAEQRAIAVRLGEKYLRYTGAVEIECSDSSTGGCNGEVHCTAYMRNQAPIQITCWTDRCEEGVK